MFIKSTEPSTVNIGLEEGLIRSQVIFVSRQPRLVHRVDPQYEMGMRCCSSTVCLDLEISILQFISESAVAVLK